MRRVQRTAARKQGRAAGRLQAARRRQHVGVAENGRYIYRRTERLNRYSKRTMVAVMHEPNPGNTSES